MKVLLSMGYNYNEVNEIVDVRETANFYIHGDDRYTKVTSEQGQIGYKKPTNKWDSGRGLYSLDSEFAKRKIEKELLKKYKTAIKASLDNLTIDQAQKISEILEITIKNQH